MEQPKKGIFLCYNRVRIRQSFRIWQSLPNRRVDRFLDTRGEQSLGPSLTEIKESKKFQLFTDLPCVCLNHFISVETKNNFSFENINVLAHFAASWNVLLGAAEPLPPPPPPPPRCVPNLKESCAIYLKLELV
jgi:hypothetical protein